MMHGQLAILIALVPLACRGAHTDAMEAPGGARSGKVTRGELADRVLLTGVLHPGASVELSVPKTEAWELTIRWIAEDGALVKAGDRVLEFDNSQFTNGLEAKRIAAVEASVQFEALKEMSVLARSVKEHELAQARIALDKATLQASVPPDLLPQRDAQTRQLEKARAEIAVEKAEKELATEKQTSALELQVKRLELEKATRTIDSARKTIGELVLTAPSDGVLLLGTHPWEGRPFRLGDTVQPGMRMLSMPDIAAPMTVRAELSDVDDGRVAVGMEGSCTLDAYPHEPLPCKVTELSPVAGTPKARSLRRAFSVVLSLAKSDPDRVRPGMSVKVELVRPHAGGPALLAPRGAVVFGESTQLRLADRSLRPVTLGECDAQSCVIVQGARDGEPVGIGVP
jgi:multidrug resistance efflux pump